MTAPTEQRAWRPRAFVGIVGACAAVVVANSGPGAAASTADPSATMASIVEVWGVAHADRVEIDGRNVPIHGGAPFAGDPVAPSPPVRWSTAAGRHTLMITQGNCLPQRFSVDVQGSLTTTVIVAPMVEARCTIGPMPDRRAQ